MLVEDIHFYMGHNFILHVYRPAKSHPFETIASKLFE